MTFCIKNYESPGGLSAKIHRQDQHGQRFVVKGPMGHGLRPKTQGVHIAFAAGTGVLCFVDLVAMIANFLLNIRQRNSSIQQEGKI